MLNEDDFTKVNTILIENIKIEKNNECKIIEIEGLGEKQVQLQSKSELSEGITDHGGSPLKQNDACNLGIEIFEKGFNSLLNL